jgi:hypothetical protein
VVLPRNHPERGQGEQECLPHVERTRHRLAAGRLFAGVARRALGLQVGDTQCGFKMFSRASGRRLFQLCREDGYLFDLEILFWAQRLGYRIAEVPIAWRDVAGSKVRLFRDGWLMATGLLRLRRSLRQRAGEMTRDSAPASVATRDLGHGRGAGAALVAAELAHSEPG